MTEFTVQSADYSIVIPVYFNEGTIRDSVIKIKREVIDTTPELIPEILLVDDGSGDNSFQEMLDTQREFPQIVKVIKLTRNFGQLNAILAGFQHAGGDCVITLSADGQDPPGLIKKMLFAYLHEGFEIAVCTRTGRDESRARVVTSRVFYNLMKRLSFRNMPQGGFDFVLLGRRALDVIRSSKEANAFFQGQVLWTGFRTKFIPYHRLKREKGVSRWTFGKKLTYLIDGVISYSFLPLRLFSAIGIGTAILGILYAITILFATLIFGNPVKGWAPVMIVILILGGLQMLMLGTIGEYLWRTLDQVRERPRYIVEAVFDREPLGNVLPTQKRNLES